MKKVNIGIVGTGFASGYHYRAFLQNRNAVIAGMCHTYGTDDIQYGVKQEVLIQKCAELNIKPYSGFDAMLKDLAIDALIICSIHPLHFEQILKAIDNGKHVLVEKPVAGTTEQLFKIKELALIKKVKVFPGHNFIYMDAIQKAKAMIEKGRIGQIIHASLISSHTISEAHSIGWRANKKMNMGGAMMDSGHHLIYQSLYLLGKPAKIHSFKSNMVLNNMECEDTMQISLQYNDGSMAVIMQTWTSDHSKMINGIRILGTAGSIVITDALYLNNKKMAGKVDYSESFVNQSKAFTNYIQNNKAPVSNLECVSDTLEIIHKAAKIADNELNRNNLK